LSCEQYRSRFMTIRLSSKKRGHDQERKRQCHDCPAEQRELAHAYHRPDDCRVNVEKDDRSHDVYSWKPGSDGLGDQQISAEIPRLNPFRASNRALTVRVPACGSIGSDYSF